MEGLHLDDASFDELGQRFRLEGYWERLRGIGNIINKRNVSARRTDHQFFRSDW